MINSSYDHTNSVWFLRVPLAKLLCERSIMKQGAKGPLVKSKVYNFVRICILRETHMITWRNRNHVSS